MGVCNTLEELNALLNDHLFFKTSNSNLLNGRNQNFWATDFIAAYSGKFHTLLVNTSSAKETSYISSGYCNRMQVLIKLIIMLTCVTTKHLGIGLERQKFKAHVYNLSSKHISKTIHLWNSAWFSSQHCNFFTVHKLIRFVWTKQRFAHYLWKVHLYVFFSAISKCQVCPSAFHMYTLF